uniref:NADH-ubiquinone oxidoreductase chain 3 n=1 Tax=Namalycastis abiuma TaxID=862681 RepID=A0A342K7Z0_9ANNE|nr:NADH dehydrogenase subunit 3 [Namalycastis abiuma]AMY15509.1 NADH dehydrogenase subunit 3 [Namalycastis abiuma]
MSLILAVTLIAAVFPLFIILVTSILNYHNTQSFEKMSPFECGFDPSSSARIPFSLRFFILVVIFLVFDIEIALLMPTPLITPAPLTMITLTTFIMILTLGLFHEWNEGSLEW